MNFADTLRGLARRWYIVIPGLMLATVLAFIVGYAVIAWLIKFISTHSFRGFVYYRLGLAAVVSVLLLTGVLQAA